MFGRLTQYHLPIVFTLSCCFFSLLRKETKHSIPVLTTAPLTRLQLKTSSTTSSFFHLWTPAGYVHLFQTGNAYHLVRIREGNKWKTAFNTHLGYLRCLAMLFVLTNVPAFFLALVNDVLRNFILFFLLLSALTTSWTLNEQQSHVWQILHRHLDYRLIV